MAQTAAPCFTLCATYWAKDEAYSWAFYAYRKEAGLTIVQTNIYETKVYTVPEDTKITDLLARIAKLEELEITFFLPSLLALPVSGVPSYNVILEPLSLDKRSLVSEKKLNLG